MIEKMNLFKMHFIQVELAPPSESLHTFDSDII